MGPMIGTDVGDPLAAEFEVLLDLAPVVPHVLRDAPQVSMASKMIDLGEWSGPWGEVQDKWAAPLADCLAEGFDFSRVVSFSLGIPTHAHIIRLDEIDAPLDQE